MKKVFVEELIENSVALHPGLDVGDFMNSQDFAHQHPTALSRDLLVRGATEPQVVGFDYSLGGGMVINVHTPGHIVKQTGDSCQMFGVADFAAMTVAASDPALQRTDLIYALLTVDEQEEEEFRSFRQAGQSSSLQRNVPTQLWNNCTVLIKEGIPAAQPSRPILANNEVALYQVQVTPGLTSLTAINIIDLRATPRSLVQLGSDVRMLASQFPGPKPTYTASEIGLGPGAGPYASRSVEEFVDDFVAAGAGITMPEILTPELADLHVNAGTLGSVGATDGSAPVVDIPAGRVIVFGTGPHTLSPDRFPIASNARVVSKAAGAGTETSTNGINFSLGNVTLEGTDAPPNFTLKNSVLPSPRFAAAMAGRGSRHIEIFGGNTGGGGLARIIHKESPTRIVEPL